MDTIEISVRAVVTHQIAKELGARGRNRTDQRLLVLGGLDGSFFSQ
jgi:hypothetical protein